MQILKKLNSFTFKSALLAFASFVLFTGVTLFVLIPKIEDVFINRKKENLVYITNIAISHIQSYYEKYQKGEISLNEAKELAAGDVENLRYGQENKDYFWINTTELKMVMHPYKPKLEGHDLHDYTDQKGNRVFVKMVDAVKANGAGFVKYHWQWKDKEEHIVPKISYVQEFEPWNWIVGTGMYVNDINVQLAEVTRNIVYWFLGIMFIIIIILIYLVRTTNKSDRQREKAVLHIKHLNSLLYSIRNINKIIVEEPELEVMMSKACQLLVNTRAYKGCSVNLLNYETERIELVAHAGYNILSKKFSVSINGDGNAPKCIKDLLQTKNPQELKDPKDCMGCFYSSKDIDKYQTIIIPMKEKGNLVGFLHVSTEKENDFEEDEIDLLNEVAGDLAFAREKIRTQKALKESELRFRNLAELLPEAVFEADLDLNLTYVNQRALDLFGYTKEDFEKGINGLDIFLQEDHPRIWERYKQKKGGDDLGPIEYTALKKDGTTFPILFHSNFIFRNNELIGIRGIIVDMSLHYKAETALMESEQRYRMLVEYSPNIIMTLKKGKITYANQVAETTLGYSLDELMDTQLIELIAPVCHDNIMALLNKSLYGFEVESSEINMVRKNMSELQTEVYYMQPVKDDEDETAVFIAKNITDQKEAERKVLKAIIDTQENERKSFAENLHDELGPFLSGIKLYIDEISSSDISKKEKDKLISYLQEMTDEAIAQTRSISNKLMPNVLINYGLFRAIQKFCQGLSATSKINITLDFNKPDKSYDKRIEVTLYRIIIELINNTLKHANASEIKIKMNDSNTILRLIYQDNGKGFAMEQLHEKEEGLGMQNIISRVKLLNGNVNIWSQPGNGLIVDIELYPHKIEGVAE